MQELQRLRVRTVTPAARCEICHQSDFFDPISNLCARCAEVRVSLFEPLAPQPVDDDGNGEQFWDLLLIGSLYGVAAAFLVGTLAALASTFFFHSPRPIRNALVFAEVAFLVGTLVGVLRRGGNAQTLRIAARNAMYCFMFGGILTGALYFINFASPNLDGLDFLKFIGFCLFGGGVFALGGGFIGAVLSVLIPRHHWLRRPEVTEIEGVEIRFQNPEKM
jgi:hypothetical protein